jgi:hypothetical protein
VGAAASFLVRVTVAPLRPVLPPEIVMRPPSERSVRATRKSALTLARTLLKLRLGGMNSSPLFDGVTT